MSERTVSFVRSLVARFPTLKATLDEHKEDNHGEILPHVFLGDVTRHVLALLPLASSNTSAGREIVDILEVFEHSYSSGNSELRELISASFLENFPQVGEDGAEVREMVGPVLRTQLESIG